MLTRRIIACLDVRDGRVVKGVRFREHRDMGDIVSLASRYAEAGVDELVFYDITASPEGRSVSRDWVRSVSDAIDVPFCVAGGITSVDTAAAVLDVGADKISVNSPALRDPDLVDRLAVRFGSQCVVVGIDSVLEEDAYRVYQLTGSTETVTGSGRETIAWMTEVIGRGAGEIVLNCMGSDGVREGYDLEQLGLARGHCEVPLIASGGAGALSHFGDVFVRADVDGALAATVFHSGQFSIHDVKQHCAQRGVAVRP